MFDASIMEKLISLGGVGVLAIILYFQNKASTSERQTLTSQFLLYLKEDKESQSTLTREVLTAVNTNTVAIATLTNQNSIEHAKHVEVLNRLSERIERMERP